MTPVDHGIALVPEDRRLQGLVLDHSVRENLLLPLLGKLQRGPFVSDRAGKALAKDLLDRFQVKVAHPGRPVRLLSGGNQQKVVIAKWLGTDPDVLIMDEPTAGVDIGTKIRDPRRDRGVSPMPARGSSSFPPNYPSSSRSAIAFLCCGAVRSSRKSIGRHSR